MHPNLDDMISTSGELANIDPQIIAAGASLKFKKIHHQQHNLHPSPLNSNGIEKQSTIRLLDEDDPQPDESYLETEKKARAKNFYITN
jgi:hypothetical protein